MTIEVEITEKYHTNNNFKKQIEEIRTRWGIGQKKYKTIINWWNDVYKLPFGKTGKITKKYQKQIDAGTLPWPYKVFDPQTNKLVELNKKNSDIRRFNEEIDKIVEKNHLPPVAWGMIFDLITKGRLSKNHYLRVFMEKIERNVNNPNHNYLLLRIYPDATIQEIRKVYTEYLGDMLGILNPGPKINKQLSSDYSKLISSSNKNLSSQQILEKTRNLQELNKDSIFLEKKKINDAKYRAQKRRNRLR